jgi:hypothetical protein
MSRARRYSLLVAAAGLMWLAPLESLAIDPPHDALQCSQCHSTHGAAYPSILGYLCAECHYSGGPAREAETHSSRLIDNGYGNWEVDCWACHDPHTQYQEPPATDGVFLRSALRAIIKEINPDDPGPYWPSIAEIRTVTGGDIVFDAASTPDSDFVDGDASFDDDICQICHLSTSNYNNSTALNSHTDYGADSQPGGDCTACHTHTNGFGVSGGGCTGCHAILQPDDSPPPAGEYRRQVTGTNGDFERKSHHVTDGTQTEIIADGDCEICHAQDNHQSNIDPQVRVYDADDHATIYTWDGSGSSLEAFCLSCHDTDGSAVDGAQPFGDGRTPTDIETGWNAVQPSPHQGNPQGCLACHGGDDSTDSLLTVLPDYEHNVHGACNDFMLSGRVDGAAVSPTVSIVRIDTPIGRNDVYEIVVNGNLVARYVASRNDTQVMVRDDLLVDINQLPGADVTHEEPVSAEAAGPIGLAVIPDDACTTFTIDLGATDGVMVLAADISAASYVCMGCHDADGPATADIVAQFQLGGFWPSETGSTLSRTHDLLLTMDCSDCHNPHSSNGLGFDITDPQRTLRPDPDPTDGWAPGDDDGDGTPDSNAGGNLWVAGVTPSSWISEWCLSCHDGTMPASIRQPAALVNIYDVWIGPSAINQHGAVGSGADLTVASGYPDGGTNTILNCETCHHKGHNIDSKLAQTLANPLDVNGDPITTSEQYGAPIEPYDDPNVDGPLWCTACHQSDMGNPACEGCHNHGDSRF